ncbi:EamA family transporter RarD [Acetobacterium sp. KB-1]|jgi:chloramphenicol-sensitive protein RarD|uniref:EamA family transporter RarD n=1 Tax=Acetobacterium sp. KB-1 TaxID=2184575 RepID=UPI000DBEBD69|nr:EamA family transporter RarD [Acetobacterium sp. KB-1]AWW26031.1 EamA family transporter RarD [Acetobacterium sp. KB-1]
MQKSIISAMMAYVLWGILPIYWKALKEVSPLYILASRIFWSFIFCVIFVTIIKKWPEIKTVLLDRKRFIYCILSGIMVSLNWYTYIWAVNANFIIDASLGYYINPLVVVLFSALFFGERFNKWESLSVLLALVGVVFITLKIGKFPVVAIVLALTFALYGVFKKKLNASPIVSLILETAVVAPFAFVAMIYIESQGQGVIALGSPVVTALAVLAGVVTAIPLLLYAKGVQDISFSLLGFFQYITPSIMLFLGVFLYGEIFTMVDLIGFGFIWVALIIFTISKIYNGSKEIVEPDL